MGEETEDLSVFNDDGGDASMASPWTLLTLAAKRGAVRRLCLAMRACLYISD